MKGWVALLRAVNVGGAGKLPMKALAALAGEVGFENARTYIASGNLVFSTNRDEAAIAGSLRSALKERAGLDTDVMVRSAAQMRAIVDANPFADAPGNRVAVLFLAERASRAMVEAARGIDDERLAPGTRELFIAYGKAGMGQSKLRLPAMAHGTARNMNTVTKLAAMAEELE
ncbi:DUF1697 domain-containing protein [Sphingomonas sp. ASV193]|uniref:DUF1697 domain-containing protein n=1 Tax=Sphingomonas sp. ASV193 TaxID=3144405 RepID=UPI0032E8A1EC